MQSDVKTANLTENKVMNGMAPSVPCFSDQFAPQRMARVNLGKCLYKLQLVGMNVPARGVN